MNDEMKNDLYQSVLITVAAVAVSMVVKKFTGSKLLAVSSLKETGKLAVAVGLGSLSVKQAQNKGYISATFSVPGTKKA